ncbi:MAG: hypothetical protein QOE71_2619 [Pseudonocardiales bacterium]|jgi:hypothetical protein|nr:hypothetical protein [Pseudonocardiales bacterium]
MMAGLADAADVFNEEFFKDRYPSHHRLRNEDPIRGLTALPIDFTGR